MKIINVARTITEQKYVANDGEQFDTEAECLQYEQSINQHIERAKQIKSIDCDVPFTSWDSEVEDSKIYILNNSNEYHDLESLYLQEFVGCAGHLFWDEPKSYPAAMMIISRECCSAGYILNMRHIQDMYNAAHQMVDAYFTVHKEKI